MKLVARSVVCISVVPLLMGVWLLCRDCGVHHAAGMTDTGLTANSHAGTATTNPSPPE